MAFFLSNFCSTTDFALWVVTKSRENGCPLSVHRSPIVSEDPFRRVAPKFLVPELGALFLVSKSGKVRVEERERDRGESSRLLVSATNVSTVLFLDGLISERVS